LKKFDDTQTDTFTYTTRSTRCKPAVELKNSKVQYGDEEQR